MKKIEELNNPVEPGVENVEKKLENTKDETLSDHETDTTE